MAFTAETLGVIVQPLGGLGVRMVSYRSDDPSGTITGAGYFAGAASYGLRVGDLIFVAPVDGAVATYIATVASFDANGNATAAVVANALTSADIGDTVQAYSANLDAWSAVAPSGYLTTASAASTYLTIATAASTYLTSATAASTYLTTAAAAAGYQPLATVLTNTTASFTTVLADKLNALDKIEHIVVACSDETTALTTGTAKVTFRMPYAMTLTAVRASLSTAQSSGSTLTVDINDGGTSIMAVTKLTIDNTEKTSTTATAAAVISDTALADDAEITIDIDQVGDGTAKGLKVTLIGTRA